jgi:hypothetical protein
MATIIASPNPVGIYSANVGKNVTIQWDTETRVNGKVSVLVNGTPKPPDLGGQAPNGSAVYNVTIPNTYTFVLRRADNNAEVARIDVATYDLRNEIIAGFASPSVPALRPQMITNVSVKPGVDTVRISFDTVRPTIPLTTLMDASGTKIDARFPLFGGLRTSHTAVFGVEVPLALEAKHTFRIVAAGPTLNKNSPTEAVVNGEFITGKRRIDIFFDTVDVHNDGDPWPSGAGEFGFRFGAGDAETGLSMGEPWPDYGPDDISDDDAPVAMNKQITIPQGPRQLWVQVVGIENDRTLWPWDWGSPLGTRPTFRGAGSTYKATAAVEQSSVTSVLDIGSEPDSWTMTFDMATGDFPVDYVVNCRLGVEMEVGAVIAPKMAKSGAPLRIAGTLEDAGTTAHIAARGAGGQSEALVLAPDGALYHRTMARDADRRDDWTRIELPGEGSVTVSASAPDALDLVFRHADGSASHRSFDPRKPRGQKWRRLGGNFRQVVPVAEPSKTNDRELFLFGVEEDGSLHVRGLNSAGDWDRVGDQAVSAVAPVSVESAGASLFAMGTDGTLLHLYRQRGRWRSQSVKAAPRRIPTLLLTAATFDRTDEKGRRNGQDVVIGALGEDHKVSILRWPDYPRGEPEGRWEQLGALQDLATPGRAPAKSKAPAKPRPSKHRTTAR